MKKGKSCELCNQQASLFCASDSAFLCWNCDATVHHANFLVARHLRHLLCSNCNTFAGNHIFGADPRRIAAVCRSCSPEKNPDDVVSLASPPSSSSSSSACVSSSESRADKIKLRRVGKIGSCSSSVTDDVCSPALAKPRRLRRRSCGSDADVAVAEAEGVFVKWSVELGLGVKGKNVASLASHALGFCVGNWKGVPFRVAAATSFWFGLRFCGDRKREGLATCQNLLSRLEAISGVPAKLILAAHARLARVFTHRLQLQEGCDES